MDLAGLSDSIGNAKPGGSGNRFKKGVYLLWTDKIFAKESDKNKEVLVIGEYEILESNNPDLPAGNTASEVFMPNGTNTKLVHPGKIRAMIAAVFGEDSFDKVGPAHIKKVLDPSNPAHGRLVRAEVMDADKKDDDGVPYARVAYKPIGPEIQAKARDLRAAAGFPPI